MSIDAILCSIFLQNITLRTPMHFVPFWIVLVIRPVKKFGRVQQFALALATFSCILATSKISDVNKTFLSRPRPRPRLWVSRPRPRPPYFFKTKTKTKTFSSKTKTKTKTYYDFTRTTEQVTISWSQNDQNSIHTTRIAVYEIWQ